MAVLPPGQDVVVSSAELRAMSLQELLVLMRRLGLSTSGATGRDVESAYTRIVAHATSIKD